MKKINIITLGCAKNIVDSEHLMGQFAASGWEVEFEKEDLTANVVVINTCGFILDAKEQSIETILSYAEAKAEGQIERLYVIGCLAERYRDELREEIPEVDEFFGVKNFYDLLPLLQAEYRNENSTDRLLTTPAHYAYLKISEGCNWGCGYCAIPLIRGRHISIPMPELIREAEQLAANGVKELIVIAQDTTYYGMDLYGERRLGELLRALCKIEGLEWIRLHYAYPAQFPQDVIAAMRDEPKICKYLDLPIQHIADGVLKSMRRGLGKQETIDLLAQLREQIPGIAIRTTLLVGYPGETEADFEELLEFVGSQRFERLGVFPYSEEEGTHSALTMDDDVPAEVKEYRAERIMRAQQDISRGANDRLVGTQQRVVIDRREGEYLVGRTQFDSPEVDNEVLISSKKSIKPGTFLEIKITRADDYEVYGEI